MNSKTESMTALFDFLDKLDSAGFYHTIIATRRRSIMVYVDVPGERLEVDFLEDGRIDVEIYTSKGKIESAGRLADLFAQTFG